VVRVRVVQAVRVVRVRVVQAVQVVSKDEALVGQALVALVAQVVAVDLLVAQVAHQAVHLVAALVAHQVDFQVVQAREVVAQQLARLVVPVDVRHAVASPSVQSVRNSTTCRRLRLPAFALHVATVRLFV